MPRKKKSDTELEQTPLVSKKRFASAFKKVLRVTKQQSDRQFAAFQASNKAKRAKR